MIGRPKPDEAAPYYFRYIDRIRGDDIVGLLETQFDETLRFLPNVSEEKSLHRYAPEKWSIRQVLNHVNDCERVFLFRAFWFARGFDSALPSFDEKVSADAAAATEYPWAAHIEEFRAIRSSALSFFRNLPADAWNRSGIASGSFFTIRALAYIIGGHVDHHTAILRDRYL